MHIYRIYSYDDEWLPLFNCTIKEFRQVIKYEDQVRKSYLYLVEA